MKFIHLLALGFFVGNLSCMLFRSGSRYSKNPAGREVLIIGHRGEAGNFPENSIRGFLNAVEKGVDGLEMDVVISADKKVVVSHEPYMSSHYVLEPTGKPINRKMETSYNFYEMEYEQIRKFESGLKRNLHFPKQKKISTYKPLLEEVIDSVESFTSKIGKKPVRYMIEVKSDPKSYGRFQPQPEEFAGLVMEIIMEKGIEERTVVKSFDPYFLNRLHQDYPQVNTSYLVSKKGIRRNLAALNFTPDYYSPRHKLVVNHRFVDSVKVLNMKLVPWTVNRKKDILRLLHLGADGIITDFPERALEARKKLRK